MIITEEMVRHIAKLSYLKLTEDETTTMARDLSSVMGSLDVLETLNTTDVVPRVHVLTSVNRWRPDDVQLSPPREALLASVPTQKDGYILVPRTLEEGGNA